MCLGVSVGNVLLTRTQERQSVVRKQPGTRKCHYDRHRDVFTGSLSWPGYEKSIQDILGEGAPEVTEGKKYWVWRAWWELWIILANRLGFLPPLP